MWVLPVPTRCWLSLNVRKAARVLFEYAVVATKTKSLCTVCGEKRAVDMCTIARNRFASQSRGEACEQLPAFALSIGEDVPGADRSLFST